MALGPLEYVAMGVQDDHAMEEILLALVEIEATGALRVLDLLVVRTDAAGVVTMQEVGEMGTAAPGVLTAEDVHTLAAAMPANATAVVVLLEHLWAQALASAVKQAGGVLYTGGLVPVEALSQVGAELATLETVAAR